MGMIEDALNELDALATRFNMEPDSDERENFISEGMKRMGFRQVSTWAEPEPEGGGDKKVSSMFGGGRTGGPTRQVGGGQQGGSGRGGNWQYGG